MSTAIQRRRGTTAQHATFTGLAGEITVDTDKNTAVVHDGVTVGGTPLATEAAVKAAQTAADAAARAFFGGSSTAADVAAKAVDCSGFALAPGAVIHVTFANASTVSGAITLNVNGSGAKPIYNQFGAVSSANPAYFPAGQPIEFVYDGGRNCWLYINRAAEAAHAAKPSGHVIAMAPPAASDGTVKAPADGSITLRVQAGGASQMCALNNGGVEQTCISAADANAFCVSVPCSKGDDVTVRWNTRYIQAFYCTTDKGAI